MLLLTGHGDHYGVVNVGLALKRMYHQLFFTVPNVLWDTVFIKILFILSMLEFFWDYNPVDVTQIF